MDFSQLKKNSGKNSLEKLTQELAKLNTQGESGKGDDRFWYPNVDKAGNSRDQLVFGISKTLLQLLVRTTRSVN
jgi:hypothetical protein